MNWQSFFSAENMALIGTVIGSVVGSLIVCITSFQKALRKYMNSGREDISKKIRKQSEIDTTIYRRMENLKEVLNADRIQIYEFHNGIHYANGRSALRTTCTYEVCRAGIQTHQTDLQAVPLSCIPNFTKKLLDDGKLEITDLENIKESMPATYQLKKSQGIKSFFDIIIKNKNDEPIGFLAIQFCKNNHNVKEDEILRFVGFLEEILSDIL